MHETVSLCSAAGRGFVRLDGGVGWEAARCRVVVPRSGERGHDHTSRRGEDLASSTSAACDARPEKVRHDSLERGHKSYILAHFFGFALICIPLFAGMLGSEQCIQLTNRDTS